MRKMAGVARGAAEVIARVCPGRITQSRATPEWDPATADALGLLELAAGQDVEPAEGSGGTDGQWRIARTSPRSG